ncbi:unnamed protein product [Soboliphyme baturini]|uniref:CMP/dCMP-type deaminase domain-containing protein n=1 Tax=Soboliphyme baturini TaxID=241478 RepID=A0A183IR09_9BILA|nr:unnamed protein product [Soboliphyme baturini]
MRSMPSMPRIRQICIVLPIHFARYYPASLLLNFSGCNIENCAYGVTICAERTALAKAVSEGHLHFKALAICSDGDEICAPCGQCRQFMIEFGDFDVYLVNETKKKSKVYTVRSLLPSAFTSADLKNPKV